MLIQFTLSGHKIINAAFNENSQYMALESEHSLLVMKHVVNSTEIQSQWVVGIRKPQAKKLEHIFMDADHHFFAVDEWGQSNDRSRLSMVLLNLKRKRNLGRFILNGFPDNMFNDDYMNPTGLEGNIIACEGDFYPILYQHSKDYKYVSIRGRRRVPYLSK